jgi:membrane-associated phospholipid phosphatase
VFPVDSPYYLLEPPGPPLAGNFFYDLVHQVSDRGGARGGAFPSAHVSGALVVGLVAWRRQRRLALALTPVIAGIVVATVYGRFHYALDTVAGLALGVTVVSAYRQFSRHISR